MNPYRFNTCLTSILAVLSNMAIYCLWLNCCKSIALSPFFCAVESVTLSPFGYYEVFLSPDKDRYFEYNIAKICIRG